MGKSICLWSEQSGDRFASLDLSTLSLDTSIRGGHLPGGSGGVYILKDQQGHRYTLKTGSTEYQLKDESFADAIYRTLGHNVPRFALYQGLPENIAGQLPLLTEGCLFRLADYIEHDTLLYHEEKIETIKAKLPQGYVLDCLLANTDIAGHWDNVLVDKEGEVWRVDNGSTLRFRAKGELKALRVAVTELDSMKSETSVMQQIFSGIRNEHIQEQTQSLLEKRSQIIELFHDMHRKLQFEQPDMLLQILVNRLQYLQEHISPLFYPYAPSHSEACLNYTGAGTLIYCEIGGEMHVLLGKRRGHDWWGSFGGASEQKDLFLSDTAARESNEELMGVYRIRPAELDKMPSHDLIIEKTPETPLTKLSVPKFRMYLVQREPVEAATFTMKAKNNPEIEEHSEFIWVKAKDLLHLKEHSHRNTRYGEQVTAAIKHNKEDIILHPPLYHMLAQEAMQNLLKKLAAKEPPGKRHTRSRMATRNPVKILLTREAMDLEERASASSADLITPKAIKHSLASSLLLRGTLHRELAANKNNTSQQDKPSKDEQSLTASEIHLKTVMGTDFKAGHPGHNVQLFLERHRQLKAFPVSKEQQDIFIDMLKEERRYPEHRVSYHSAMAELGFLYEVFTEFRRQLEHQYHDDYHVLRAFDDLFIEFQDIVQFMMAHQDSEGIIDNYSKNYQEMGLSVNPFIFGSDGNDTSATYRLFMDNKNIDPPDTQKLFDYFAARLHLNINFADFHVLFKRYRKKAGASCYQIFVEKQSVDEVTYPARSGGRLNPLKIQNEQEITKYSEVLSALEAHPQQHAEYIKGLQARLFLRPDIFHDSEKVHIKSWLANPLSKEETYHYQHALQDLVSESLQSVLREFKDVSDQLFFRGKPGLMRLLELLNEQQALPAKKISDYRVIIPELIQQQRFKELTSLLFEKDIDLQAEEIARDYMSSRTSQKHQLSRVIANSLDDTSSGSVFLDEFYRKLAEKVQTDHPNPRMKDILLQLIPFFIEAQNISNEYILKTLDLFSIEDRHEISSKTSEAGNTLLHKTADDPDALISLLQNVPKDQIPGLVKLGNSEGSTVLHRATKNPEALRALFEFLSPEQQLDAVRTIDNRGTSVLHEAAINSESLSVLLGIYSDENERFKALTVRGHREKTVFHYAVKSPQSLQTLLEFYPEDDRLPVVSLHMASGQTVLHKAIYNPESLRIILSLLPLDQRMDALFSVSENFDSTPLQLAVASPEAMKSILMFLPDQQKLAALKTKNSDKTVLDGVSEDPTTLKSLLELLPVNQRLAAFRGTDKYSDQLDLHFSIVNPEYLMVLLESLPKEQRLDALKLYDSSNKRLLHTDLPLESLKTILLELLPARQRLEAVKLPSKRDKKNLLHETASQPEYLKFLLDLYPEKERLNAVQITDKDGRTVLHHTAANPESIKIILALYPEDQKLEAVNKTDAFASTVLHYSLANHQALKALLKMYPEENRLEALTTGGNRCTVLYIAARYFDSMNVILKLLPEQERIEAISIANQNGYTLLHDESLPDSLIDILKLLPKEKRLEALQLKQGRYGVSVLAIVSSKNPHLLKSLIKLLPVQHRLKAMKETNLAKLSQDEENVDLIISILRLLPKEDLLSVMKMDDGSRYERRCILHNVRNPESFIAILELIPEDKRFDAVTLMTPDSGLTVLDLARSESLSGILKLLPKDKWIDILQFRGNSVTTPLHKATDNPEAIKAIFTLIPVPQRFNACRVSQYDGRTVLHFAAENPESLKLILNLLPKDKRFEAVKLTDYEGDSILFPAIQKPESLELVLRQYPTNERLDAVKKRDIENTTVLHVAAAWNSESMKMVLELYPEKEKIAAIKIKNKKGLTVLHYAAYNPESMQHLLALYPPNEKLHAMKMADKKGKSVLDYICRYNDLPKLRKFYTSFLDDHDILKALLENTPEAKRFDLLKKRDVSGKTLFHLAAAYPNALKIFLECLPEDQRFNKLKQADKTGTTALHVVIKNPESVKVMIGLLADDQTGDVLKILWHKNAIEDIKSHINTKKWNTKGSAFFANEASVPPCIADIARLITDLEHSDDFASLPQLYSDIQTRAKEALATPGMAQQDSLRFFLEDLIKQNYSPDMNQGLDISQRI